MPCLGLNRFTYILSDTIDAYEEVLKAPPKTDFKGPLQKFGKIVGKTFFISMLVYVCYIIYLNKR